MLFDPRPKCSRDELFDRERELAFLEQHVEAGEPLILVLGIRRIGKTSLVKSFLSDRTGIYVDMRGVRREADLYRALSKGLSGSLGGLKEILQGIRGIRITGVGVEFKWRGRDSISMLGLLEELNKAGKRITVVFDEAQRLRPPLLVEMRDTLAYVYDNLDNISVVLTGSEIGLLRGFLGIGNPESPLYGRYAAELEVSRFSRGLSMEFLEKGFREAGIMVDESILEEAVELFDGIVGWLVFFGRSYINGDKNTDRIVEIAVQLALKELGTLSRREKFILKAVSSGARSWSAIRSYIEEKEGESIPKASLTRTIRRLERLSIIKNYRFLDPIYEKASMRLT